MDHGLNIVIVLFDQLRQDAVADPGLATTPHLDRLRSQGTWFAQHHTPAGLCSPARASLMTGLLPHTHGVITNVHGPEAPVRELPREHVTLAELLAGAGYRTGYVGKWHLGPKGPGKRGFADVRFPEAEEDPALSTWLSDRLESMVYTRPRSPGGPAFPLYLRQPVPPDLVLANRTAADAVALLEEYGAAPDPYLLVVAFAEPHHPTILSEDYVDRYDPAAIPPWPSFGDTFAGKPGANEASLRRHGVDDFTWDDWAPVVARYLATVTMLDDRIGQLLSALDAARRADETVVVMTSDHGDLLGCHRQFDKGPLMYEEVYRVPLVVRCPGGRGGAGRRVEALTSHVDLLPTLAELAGVPLHGGSWPGRSLVPWLDGDTPTWRAALVAEFDGDEFGLYSQRMLRRGQHKFVYNPYDVDEFYDLAADPHELHNLAASPAASSLRCELGRALLEMMQQTGDPLALFAATTLG